MKYLSAPFHVYPRRDGGVHIVFIHDGWDYSIIIRSDMLMAMRGDEIDGLGEMDTLFCESATEFKKAVMDWFSTPDDTPTL